MCRPQCPTGAIDFDGERYTLDPDLCDKCQSYPEPQCIVTCPVNSPVPLQAKKGRCKVNPKIATSPDLFADGKRNRFASALVIWEASNILSQRSSLPWQLDDDQHAYYQRQIKSDRGSLIFRVTDALGLQKESNVENLDIRAACLHLLYAAYATTLEEPWTDEFAIGDRQIEEYLGLDKRKDLTKATKLTLIKELARQPCQISVSLNWYQPGKIGEFCLKDSPLWELLEIQHDFQEDDRGCKHLAGLTFRIRTGRWAQHFLNRKGCQERRAFYQYGILPKSLLGAVMSIWQQHEGAARMLLWLLFKTKMGREQRITVPTLMRVAYGENKVERASTQREERKRLLSTFESDLEVLHRYGLKPAFDPVTYPPDIQPFWAKLADIPEDAEDALDFWINDGSRETRLTDTPPRGKWNRLMNARILYFELPSDWEQQQQVKKTQHNGNRKQKSKSAPSISPQEIIAARKNLELSQRDLAQLTGKSQSWIRDVERGRFQVKDSDRFLLRKMLNIT